MDVLIYIYIFTTYIYIYIWYSKSCGIYVVVFMWWYLCVVLIWGYDW